MIHLTTSMMIHSTLMIGWFGSMIGGMRQTVGIHLTQLVGRGKGGDSLDPIYDDPLTIMIGRARQTVGINLTQLVGRGRGVIPLTPSIMIHLTLMIGRVRKTGFHLTQLVGRGKGCDSLDPIYDDLQLQPASISLLVFMDSIFNHTGNT